MSDYLNLELATLLDLLAENTRQFTQLMSEGFKNGEEFSHMEQKIISLQQAIKTRQDFQYNQTATNQIKFEE